MIGYLSGTLFQWDANGVILDVNGVGYRVSVPATVLRGLPATGEPLELWIHTRMSQEDLRLYGFASSDGLRVFERLLTVPRVGPKLAIGILGQLPPVALRSAILSGDVKKLSSLSGVGKRTAERIIVDLGQAMKEFALDGDDADSAASLPVPDASPAAAAMVALERALASLGYKEKEMRPAMRALESRALAGEPIESLLKEALKLLR